MKFVMDNLRSKGEHHDEPHDEVEFSFAERDTVEISVKDDQGQSVYVEVDAYALVTLLHGGIRHNAQVFARDDIDHLRHRRNCAECRGEKKEATDGK